jgi:hypothetical protein
VLPPGHGTGLSVERPAAPLGPPEVHEMRPSRQQGLARRDSPLRVRVMDQQPDASVSKLDEEPSQRHRRSADHREGQDGHHVNVPGPDRVREGHQSPPGLPGTGVARREVSKDPNRIRSEFGGEMSEVDFLRRSRSGNAGRIPDVNCQSLHLSEEQQDRRGVNQFQSVQLSRY